MLWLDSLQLCERLRVGLGKLPAAQRFSDKPICFILLFVPICISKALYKIFFYKILFKRSTCNFSKHYWEFKLHIPDITKLQYCSANCVFKFGEQQLRNLFSWQNVTDVREIFYLFILQDFILIKDQPEWLAFFFFADVDNYLTNWFWGLKIVD